MTLQEQDYPPLRLKKGEERRLQAGHLWVFSNEIDTAATPLRDFQPGQGVRIETQRGRIIGTGYVNPQSLIVARLVSRDHRNAFSPSLLVHRLKVAMALRERLYSRPFYRVVHGESDGLPGLVVDRYDRVLVAQITTAGMEAMKAELVTALLRVLKPAALLWRNDSAVRELEGLPQYTELAHGELPHEMEVEEHGLRFAFPLTGGQKTGWYLDQHDNRGRLGRYVRDAKVLDACSYVGAWGVQAAANGASHVLCVDSSEVALDYARKNAAVNGVSDRVECRRGDVFKVLESLHEAGERFGVVIVDPPAFIRRRRDQASGEQGYRRLNQLAMQVLERDAILISCSCSYHLDASTLAGILLRSARHLDRSIQFLEHGQQAADHPIHPAIPETAYLKAFFARVLPA